MRPNVRIRECWLALAMLMVAGSRNVASAEDRSPTPTELRLRGDVSYLADDEREDVAPGRKGIELAADYIANAFKEAGLKPARGANGYFQPFELSGVATVAGTPELLVKGPGDKQLKATSDD